MAITNLSLLLQQMDPQLSEFNYYFCTFKTYPDTILQKTIGTFREKEGWTVILEEKDLPTSCTKSNVQSLITLTVYSDLQAVGFLAVISKAMAEAGISINVVSGYYHDHIFVPQEFATKAMEILHRIQEENKI